MDKSLLQMRNFIDITEADESLVMVTTPPEGPSLEPLDDPATNPILADLADIVFRLRAYSDENDGDLGLGVEMGMQRAADMIEHVLERYKDIEIG